MWCSSFYTDVELFALNCVVVNYKKDAPVPSTSVGFLKSRTSLHFPDPERNPESHPSASSPLMWKISSVLVFRDLPGILEEHRTFTL